MQKVQESVLSKWSTIPQNGEKDVVSNILAHASDVLENASPLNDDDYDVAMKRVRDLLDLDLEAEAAKRPTRSWPCSPHLSVVSAENNIIQLHAQFI